MRRAAVLAVALVVALSGVAMAKGGTAKVTGTYTYWFDWGPGRLISVNAKVDGAVKGTWSYTQLISGGGIGNFMSGDVTCFKVDGHDAWVAGPATRTDVDIPANEIGVFLWVHDSGLPGGVGDMAITWGSDPGISGPHDMETLCEHKVTSFGQAELVAIGFPWTPDIEAVMALQPLTTGNIVIHASR